MIKAKEIPKLNSVSLERFISKIKMTPNCWEWTGEIGGTSRQGYGRFRILRKMYAAHRISFEIFRRTKIPLDMVIDHLCRNRSCVNPFHLEIVTLSENNLRGEGIHAQNKRKTHCSKGHELTPDNIIKVAKRPNERQCRKCHHYYAVSWTRRNREKNKAV